MAVYTERKKTETGRLYGMVGCFVLLDTEGLDIGELLVTVINELQM